MDALKLKNQLCFPLYAASKEVVRRYTPFLDAIGLTYTQYIVMMVLWEQRALTVKALGAYLYLDSGTLTPLLKNMEQAKLVARRRAEDGDARTVIVTPTKQGDALKEKAAAVPGQIAACMPLSAEEAQQLYGLLYKVLDGFSKKQ